MSEASHTPGPWVVGRYGNVTTGNGDILLVSGVALTAGNHPNQGEAEANARLIAAAPELLVACKLALEPFTNPDVADERRARCRAAIAKAQGKEQP